MPKKDPHTVIQRLIVDTAQYLGLVGEFEWKIDHYGIDAVWKKTTDSSPFCIFEIELSQNIPFAIARLNDAWLKYSNPSLYLIVKEWQIQKAIDIIKDSFPDMLDKIKLLSVDDVNLFCKRFKEFAEASDKFFHPYKPNLKFRKIKA
jgi:hypothetical protein